MGLEAIEKNFQPTTKRVRVSLLRPCNGLKNIMWAGIDRWWIDDLGLFAAANSTTRPHIHPAIHPSIQAIPNPSIRYLCALFVIPDEITHTEVWNLALTSRDRTWPLFSTNMLEIELKKTVEGKNDFGHKIAFLSWLTKGGTRMMIECRVSVGKWDSQLPFDTRVGVRSFASLKMLFSYKFLSRLAMWNLFITLHAKSLKLLEEMHLPFDTTFLHNKDSTTLTSQNCNWKLLLFLLLLHLQYMMRSFKENLGSAINLINSSHVFSCFENILPERWISAKQNGEIRALGLTIGSPLADLDKLMHCF